jgi:hypothetical protein
MTVVDDGGARSARAQLYHGRQSGGAGGVDVLGWPARARDGCQADRLVERRRRGGGSGDERSDPSAHRAGRPAAAAAWGPRQLREAAGDAIRASDVKISRMELGRVGLKERDVRDLLTL